MSRAAIPQAQKTDKKAIRPNNTTSEYTQKKIVFSFATIDKNEYFNLDATCQNWSADLFDTLKTVSSITVGEVFSGKYSRDGSPLRIHRHENAKPPCSVPNATPLSEMWQIRISASKGGIHGFFIDETFYVVWFDPQHNLYPDENHGGLKRIQPPSTCCKDRDELIHELTSKLNDANEDVKTWKALAESYQKEE